MAVGFGHTTETADQYIKNFLKQNQARFDPYAQQEDWYDDYSRRKHSYSLSELLAPEYKELEIELDPYIDWCNPSHKHLKVRVGAYKGLWNLQVVWDPKFKLWDLTISVKAGDCNRFHPDVIEEDITLKYGSVVYKQWQAMVMDDLDSLQTLVNEVRDRIDFVAPSIVCCERSARLCRRVGIPVKGQFAFLFPSSYSA